MAVALKERLLKKTPKDAEWRCPLCKREDGSESNKHHSRPKVEGKEKSGPTVPLGKGCHAFLHEKYTNGELRKFFEDCKNDTESLRKLRKLYHKAIRQGKIIHAPAESEPLAITLEELHTFWRDIGMPPYWMPASATNFFPRRI